MSHPHLRKSITNFRHRLEVTLKLAVTLETLIHRGKLHLTAIPLEGWKINHLQICPPGLQSHFERIPTRVPDVPLDPEDWKKIEERFRNRWDVPHAVGALDGKHIAIKKSKKSGSEYFNYKGYFYVVLLALVNAGSSGSSFDIPSLQTEKKKFRMEPWDYHHLNH